jgi:hypothetical protein
MEYLTRDSNDMLVITPVSSPIVEHTPEVARSIIPVGSQWPGARPGQVCITPDGRSVLYQSNRGDGRRLFIHTMGDPDAREIEGLGDGPYFPDVSPNGKWLLFGKKGWIWKAPLEGGPMTLLYTGNTFKAWESDDWILVSKGPGGIWRVKADGSRREERVATIDSAIGATNYGRPSRLPDGSGFLTSVGFGPGVDRRNIGIISLPDGNLTLINEYGINPRYAESGHILYTQGSTLRAIPFDLRTRKALGRGAIVVEGVHVYSSHAAQFDISPSGTLVYVEGSSELNRVWPRVVAWVDRDGNETPFDTCAEKAIGTVRLSPNRRYLAAEVGTGLNLFDRQSGTWSVLAAAGNAACPIWDRSSQNLYYTLGGVFGRQSVQPVGEWEKLWSGDTQFYGSWISRDGGQAFGTAWIPSTGLWQLMSLTLGGTPSPGPVLGASDLIRRNPAISPDGRWLAYVEKARGMDRVFIQSTPGGGRPLLMSGSASGEASEPTWGRTSNELFYRDAANIVSVQFTASPELRITKEKRLFEIRGYYSHLSALVALHHYDPATDRFLMVRNTIPELPGTDIQVIENAFELLNRVAPHRQ